MAHQEQLGILQMGVEAWNHWRDANPFVNVVLSEIDLSGADLRAVNFRQVNLRQANLSGANFFAANLRQANLSGANLCEANFSNANLPNANFSDTNLTDAVFREADLSRAILFRAYFPDADLVAANFRKALLQQANFHNADLSGANLSGANLDRADLIAANLNGVELSEANLRQANLADANLMRASFSRADLTGSRMGNTTLVDNDLSEAVGLEKIYHYRPSTIDTSTIRRSKGTLPIEFLRGCGLSDLEIESAKLAAPGLDPEQVSQITYEIYRLYCDQPIQFYSCFISYSNTDHEFARRLHDDLQNNGVRCWFAPEDLKIGDEFRPSIGKEIRLRDKLLIILSKNSIDSEWVGDEVEKALAEEKEQGTLKLFPIRLDDAVLQSKDNWAEKIRLRRHIGDFSKDYAAGLARLLRDLKPLEDAKAEIQDVNSNEPG